jgi:general nucleoside transport system ATP-binding protein
MAAEGTDQPLPIIHLSGITKRFGGFTANDGIDLTLQRGEIHALLGENGAGKSTLMKILNGLIKADAGQIEIEGKIVSISEPDSARAQGIGMVFQHFALFEGLTALENIAIGLKGGLPDHALKEKLKTLAADYGLEVAPDAVVAGLSAGERQRIELLRCLLQEPRVLVLDEPTSVLTPQEAEQLFAMLRKLASRGTSILFISHKLEEVKALCSMATILRGGKVVAVLDPRTKSARELAGLLVGEGIGDIARKNASSPGAAQRVAVKNLSRVARGGHGVSLLDVSFDIHAGDIAAIAGIAGNGQSELFGCLSGESVADRGSILLDGTDVTALSITARRQRGAAFVPEDRLGHGAVPGRALSDNMALSSVETTGALSILRRSGLRAAADAVVRAFDVRVPKPDPAARQLSGGNLQKFVIGREMARSPRFLLVNQPSWGVDAKAALAIRQALVDLAATGAAVLIISQDLDEVFEIATKVAVIVAGRLGPFMPIGAIQRDEIGLMMTGGKAAA